MTTALVNASERQRSQAPRPCDVRLREHAADGRSGPNGPDTARQTALLFGQPRGLTQKAVWADQHQARRAESNAAGLFPLWEVSGRSWAAR